MTPQERIAAALEAIRLELALIRGLVEQILALLRARVADRLYELTKVVITKREGRTWLRSVIFGLLTFVGGVLASQGYYLAMPPINMTPCAPVSSTSAP